MTTRFFRYALIVSILTLAGCVAARTPQPVAESSSTTSAKAASETATPSAELIEFTLGPHRFALPSNYFVDEQGPDFQGNVTLALLWPELKPYPPGNGYWKHTAGPMRNHGVIIRLGHIDRVPIDSLPGRYVTIDKGEDANDPGRNIALRIRKPDQFGLEHYAVDLEKKAVWLNRFPGSSKVAPEELASRMSDWFIARDAKGVIRTAVLCDDSRQPEGFEIRGDELVSIPGTTRSPLCDNHDFSLHDYSSSVTLSYHRPLLRDWRKMESAVKDIMRSAYRGREIEAKEVK